MAPTTDRTPLGTARIALLVLSMGAWTAAPSACSSGASTTAGATSATSSGTGGAGGAPPAAPYTLHALADARITSDSSQPNFQKVTADVDFANGPFEKVTLHVSVRSTCYPFDNWKSDPPPSGQSWPADCDAFDRNFETALYPAGAAPGTTGVELVRAITPFGGPLAIDEDITDVANGLPGPHRLEVTIPTYSDGAGKVSGSNGGWNVTADIDVVPGTPPRNVLAVVPLYYDSDTLPAGPGPLPFEAPEGVVSGHVDYRVTGHGGPNTGPGCIGPAEEFCKRDHDISVDGQVVAVTQPWRTDCVKNCTLTTYGGFSQPITYCLENPCGDPSSVKAPRANWCPGTETPPITYDVPATPGAHSFQFAIPKMLDGGQWRVSATYFAYGP